MIDPTIILVASASIVGHAVIAYYVAPRYVLARVRAELATLESRWSERIALMLGEAIRLIDWADAMKKLPVVEWLETASNSKKLGPVLDEVMDKVVDRAEPVIQQWLKQSFGGKQGAEKRNDRAAMGDLVASILDRFGVMPMLDGLGLGDTVRKNPEGALRLAMQLFGPQIQAMLDRIGVQTHQEGQIPEQP